ncbi:bifunctional transcriptional activator/DNA repair enzyme AdaA [Yoonia sp. 208BN28-4]|uniref:bifunctional transcriptional activator/DNA repair enzyme AdaA n=1 Tax=Yoonia sp. 208BN28-4 TaxID=3126505 RepID=UPI0030AFC2A3
MLFALPDPETLYDALIARDPVYDGRAFVGVATTGVFCRLTCPARKPKAENCKWFDSAADCITAGFRPCRRCHPLVTAGASDPVIATLLGALDTAPDHRWSEDDVAQRGFDPSTVRRAFKRSFGMTFLEMARQRRLACGFTTLGDTGRVIDAQLAAGFDSPSAFRAAFARLLGGSPAQFRKDALLRADWIDTPLGAMVAVSDAHALHLLEFADRKALPAELKRLIQAHPSGIGLGRHKPTDQVEAELAAYFAGQDARFTTPLAKAGSSFTRSVWDYLRTIPAGQVRTYGQIAQDIGRPTATRAVARANGANQIAIVIPCHRVLGADGALTGYGGGLWRKDQLIAIEKKFV